MNDDSAMFDGEVPQYYDRNLGPVIFSGYAEDMAARAAASRPSHVLETAAGTGIVTRRLRDVLPAEARLTATDLNASMLEVACNKFRADERVEFRSADATWLPFSDGVFDMVVCQFGVMFFQDKPKSYREVYRVLAPGGRYLLSVWDSRRHNPFGQLMLDATHGLFPADPPQFPNVPFSCHEIDPIKENLIEAGFGRVSIDIVKLEKEISDTAAFARGLVFGTPLAGQIEERGGVGADLAGKLAESLVRKFGTGPGRMPLQAIIFSAIKP
jgi:SAM-dependent methyltransferase